MTKKISGFIILLIFTILAAVSHAEQAPLPSAPAAPPAHPVIQHKTAPVVVDGVTLFKVRGVEAYPAEERAAGISDRIRKAADNPDVPADSIIVSETPLSSDIVAGGEPIMSVLDADASLEGVKRQVLANILARKVRSTVESYREKRRPEAVLYAVFYTILATLVLSMAIFLFWRLSRKAGVWAESKFRSKVKPLHIKNFDILQADRVWAAIARLIKAARIVIVLLILYFYAHRVLSFFPWTLGIAAHLLDYAISPLRSMGLAVLAHVPNIIFIIILVVVTRYVIHICHLFFESVQKGTLTISGFDPDWSRPTYKIVRLAVIAFAAVMAYPHIPGSNSPAFKGLSIFIGVLFSLGSSSVVSNIIAGYTLIYRRTFKVGDRVRIAEYIGDVTAMRVQVTHLRTIKNEAVIVPNSLILASNVVNYSSYAREQGLILHTQVTIGYDAPWRQVEAMLLKAAEKTNGLLKEPVPFVLQRSLDDFYVSYELNAYTDHPQGMDHVYADLHRNIQDAFNEYGVQIMSPHYYSDPAGAKVVPKERWYEPPANTDGV